MQAIPMGRFMDCRAQLFGCLKLRFFAPLAQLAHLHHRLYIYHTDGDKPSRGISSDRRYSMVRRWLLATAAVVDMRHVTAVKLLTFSVV